jgi:hypothetical protein
MRVKNGNAMAHNYIKNVSQAWTLSIKSPVLRKIFLPTYAYATVT